MGQTLLSKKGQTHFTFWFFEINLNSDQFRLIFVFFRSNFSLFQVNSNLFFSIPPIVPTATNGSIWAFVGDIRLYWFGYSGLRFTMIKAN